MARKREIPRSFWFFYSSLMKAALSEGYGVIDGFLAAIAVAAFLISFFNRELAKQIEFDWQGWSRSWSAVPLAAILLYRIARTNYMQFEEVVGRMDAIKADLKAETEKSRQPDVALMWEWLPNEKALNDANERTEKRILIHNRSSEYVYNVQLSPIPLGSGLVFDPIPEIEPNQQHLTVGRWDDCSSDTTKYVYFFGKHESEAMQKGLYVRKPHNRGLSDAWYKVPMSVTYESPIGKTWETSFEFTYDPGDETYFKKLSGKRV
jgi:hypothetical protein